MSDEREKACLPTKDAEDGLSEIYQAGRREPPARLDTAIRAAARQSLGAPPDAVSNAAAGTIPERGDRVSFGGRFAGQNMRYGFAMAAGLLLGVFLTQLLLIEPGVTPGDIAATDTVFRGAANLKGQQDQQADLDGMPELSTLPREEWLLMISDYLAAGDSETADALMRAYVKQFPPRPEGETIQP